MRKQANINRPKQLSCKDFPAVERSLAKMSPLESRRTRKLLDEVIPALSKLNKSDFAYIRNVVNLCTRRTAV